MLVVIVNYMSCATLIPNVEGKSLLSNLAQPQVGKQDPAASLNFHSCTGKRVDTKRSEPFARIKSAHLRRVYIKTDAKMRIDPNSKP
tara:strand:+ start:215 stop:475 length:261 start_codon:yes stop_codon:yes gene_type:complete